MTAPQVRVDGLGDATTGGIVALTAEDLHHLRRVLRLTEGAALRLTDGAGAVADARLVGEGAALDAAPVRTPRPAPRLALAQALTRGRRADEAVRTACELGVDLVVPVVAARTQGRPGAAERAALVGRWRAVAAAALTQSRGAWDAEVAPVTDVAGLAGASAWDGVRVVAVPGAPPLPDVLRAAGAATTVGIAVGPEGGWTPEEVAVLENAGWHRAGLGPTVLRSEHAGPVALAVAAAATGRWDLGG